MAYVRRRPAPSIKRQRAGAVPCVSPGPIPTSRRASSCCRARAPPQRAALRRASSTIDMACDADVRENIAMIASRAANQRHGPRRCDDPTHTCRASSPVVARARCSTQRRREPRGPCARRRADRDAGRGPQCARRRGAARSREARRRGGRRRRGRSGSRQRGGARGGRRKRGVEDDCRGGRRNRKTVRIANRRRPRRPSGRRRRRPPPVG